ncbi:erythromycin esterase-like protein [Pontibacter ummariensis]|uniref:Erythromycin esterase homolog n=1 Tax=Pontibacter ummariensis TaxID=1610492 RepID=A0A239GNF5_9BACT|nr:erythromycin esterase family protein [Pontibacter ummariensis]PRY11344.1 erythromycin esterase-like protein [Pontibacter ummariensis]SNS70342.1 Erythromycin esterase homolog [Pontibacter ummariensis]
MATAATDLLTDIKKDSYPLQSTTDLDPLMDRIGDAKYVLLGEASHGTHEYYTWRTDITKRLIKEKGFSFVAVEGDWPDCFEINRWVKGYPEARGSITDVLNQFDRWPTWMWANWEVAALAEWMREHNQNLARNRKVGFYGLDVYSLWESMELIVDYLEKEDPKAAVYARKAIDCFEPYGEEEAYASALSMMKQDCKDAVVKLLHEVRQKAPFYDHDPEARLNAEMNALVAANGEKYYRTMASFGGNSWNVRDLHMVETLNSLMNFHGPEAKVIVWEHNTHVGDARATSMADRGMLNVGQLVREQHKPEEVVVVGFGSYEGSVIAGSAWGARMQEMKVPQAVENSVEEILHAASAENKMLVFDNSPALKEFFNRWMGHRAIGVVYDPGWERGNYVPTKLSARYDAFLYFDQSRALHPLHLKPNGHLAPETFPFGI